MLFVHSCINSSCSFWSGIKEKTKKNYNTTAQIIEMPAKYIARGIGSVAWSLALNGVGTLVDRYWQPEKNFPPLFATIGFALGPLSGLGQPLVKVAFIPINGIFSFTSAIGEEIVESISVRSQDFHITYNYFNDMLFFRYNDENGQMQEMQPNPSLLLNAFVGAIIGTMAAYNFFTNVASFAIPFAAFIGLPPKQLAIPFAAVVGVAVARPTTKMLAFTAGLLAIPAAPVYRLLKRREQIEQQEQPPDLGDMLESQSYVRLSLQ